MQPLSVLIQLWRGTLVRTSQASDIVSNRRIKLEGLFLFWVYFQRMSAASVLIQKAWRGSHLRSTYQSTIVYPLF
jgi:hypothetical protein